MAKLSQSFLKELAEASLARNKGVRQTVGDGVPEDIRNKKNLSDEDVKHEDNGALNDRLKEPVPFYNKAPSEKVIQGKNNTWIVLGRDRPGGLETGYGGAAHMRAGSIDLVVGRMSPVPAQTDDKGQKIIVDSSYKSDAARIIISQKTDIDQNFELADGLNQNKASQTKGKSAIGVKADNVRIVARQGIKLVTRTDEINSRGGLQRSVSGIDLIAGNESSDLQPMVKGESLVNCLDALREKVSNLAGILHKFMKRQTDFNFAVGMHQHPPARVGGKVFPSRQLISEGLSFSIQQYFQAELGMHFFDANLAAWKANYLTAHASRNSDGKDQFILSRYNNVN